MLDVDRSLHLSCGAQSRPLPGAVRSVRIRERRLALLLSHEQMQVMVLLMLFMASLRFIGRLGHIRVSMVLLLRLYLLGDLEHLTVARGHNEKREDQHGERRQAHASQSVAGHINASNRYPCAPV